MRTSYNPPVRGCFKDFHSRSFAASGSISEFTGDRRDDLTQCRRIAKLQAAAFHNADSFDEAVLKAVNLGDDADTTGAICGQLAGAYWGESNIPQSLRSGLARMDMLETALVGTATDREA